MDEKIRITIEAYGKKSITELADDSGIIEIIQAITSQLLFFTFPLNTILMGYKEETQQIEELFDFVRNEER